MESYIEPLAIFGDLKAETCESCGRHPARRLTVRRHIGLIYFQRFVTVEAVACRACGRRLVRDFTLRTLVQGWWGAFSFFFNVFVLVANAVAWLRFGGLAEPSISGTDGSAVPRGSAAWDGAPNAKSVELKKWSGLVKIGVALFLSFAALALWGWSDDATHHDHRGSHAQPVTALDVKNELYTKMFVAEGRWKVWVESADCVGEGGSAGRHFHFQCRLLFDNGEADEVLVHLLPDGVFFNSLVADGT